MDFQEAPHDRAEDGRGNQRRNFLIKGHRGGCVLPQRGNAPDRNGPGWGADALYGNSLGSQDLIQKRTIAFSSNFLGSIARCLDGLQEARSRHPEHF